MSTLLLFPFGALCGFCSSAPIGPINLWVGQATLQKGQAPVRPFLAGVILADLLWASVAFWGHSILAHLTGIQTHLALAGGLFLTAIGVVAARQALLETGKSSVAQTLAAPPSAGAFALGFWLCASNPSFLAFWLFASALASEHFPGQVGTTGYLLLLAGAFVGDVLWFGLFKRMVTFGADRATPLALKRVRITIACLLILMGLISIWRIRESL